LIDIDIDKLEQQAKAGRQMLQEAKVCKLNELSSRGHLGMLRFGGYLWVVMIWWVMQRDGVSRKQLSSGANYRPC